jgi:pyruvate formate lyase activating enzyme
MILITMTTLAELLDSMTNEGEFHERAENDAVRCFSCAHRCLIRPGKRGICKVRFNRAGTLRVPWGYVAGLQSDPIEKKPFYHMLPASDALTFGMLGCDFHCSFCQNWVSSQAMRDPASEIAGRYLRRITAQDVVSYGVKMGASVVASSYNEPLITSEWALAIFKLAVDAGLKCAFVSNGNATPEVLARLAPYMTGLKIDLKSMQDKQYRRLGGVLQNVLDTIRLAHEMGLWVEVVTLIVPDMNDSTEELMDAGRFIASVSADIPWHVTAFHPNYQMSDKGSTPVKTLLRAAEIGQEAGLHFVYAGNLPGQVSTYENTFCPSCSSTLIERLGYVITGYHLSDEGACQQCGHSIPGIWHEEASSVQVRSSSDLPFRGPIPIR